MKPRLFKSTPDLKDPTKINLHSLSGPAVTFSNGENLYFINGVEFTEEEYYSHPLIAKIPLAQRPLADKLLNI